jgi:hypothetical protein
MALTSFSGVSLTSSDFTGVTFSLVGDILTIDIPGYGGAGIRTARFDFQQPTGVPETGATMLLLGMGVAALLLGQRVVTLRARR